MSNVLFLSPRWPWPIFDGGRIRIYETLRYLAGKHRVTLVSGTRAADGQVRPGPIDAFCEQTFTSARSDRLPAVASRLASGLARGIPFVQSFFYDKQLAARVAELTFRTQFDIIHVEYPIMAPYLQAIDRRNRARKVLGTQNIESIRFQRETRFSRWDSRRLLLMGDQLLFKSWERDAIRKFDGVIAVSEIEQEWIRENAPGVAVELAPNGVDAQFFSFSGPCPSSFLTFVGSMDYPPNIDAAIWFAEEVLPGMRRRFSDLIFRIVGSRPDPLVLSLRDRPGVEVTGEVDDIRPYLRQSLGLVVPLRSGGGTRLKILQAMAVGCPVISTRVGAEGLDVQPGLHFLAADSPDAWTEAVGSLRSSAAVGLKLAEAGRQLVDSKYDWSKCLTGVDRLYERLLESGSK